MCIAVYLNTRDVLKLSLLYQILNLVQATPGDIFSIFLNILLFMSAYIMAGHLMSFRYRHQHRAFLFTQLHTVLTAVLEWTSHWHI
jgi:hypothetical protein